MRKEAGKGDASRLLGEEGRHRFVLNGRSLLPPEHWASSNPKARPWTGTRSGGERRGIPPSSCPNRQTMVTNAGRSWRLKRQQNPPNKKINYLYYETVISIYPLFLFIFIEFI